MWKLILSVALVNETEIILYDIGTQWDMFKYFQQNPKKSLDQKLTPQKSHAKFLTLKTLNITNSMFVYVNSYAQEHLNTCQIFLPKKIPESKISNPAKSFYHLRHMKFRVPLPPASLGSGSSACYFKVVQDWKGMH